MSGSTSEVNPEIMVNGEKLEQQEEQNSEDETQSRMQSVLQQVRKQIRSQVSAKPPKSSILELVQKIRDMEAEQVSSGPEGKDVSSGEDGQAEQGRQENNLKEEDLCVIFEEKLELSMKTLKEEFQVQISEVRKEMQAYTDQALKASESKMQANNQSNVNREGKAPDKKQNPSAAPFRRGRVLTRTMTTIVPKTCAPVVVGPRAKSETLTSSKGECSRFLPRDPVLSVPGNKPYQGRKPLIPAHPPLQQRKKNQAKAKTGAPHSLGDN